MRVPCGAQPIWKSQARPLTTPALTVQHPHASDHKARSTGSSLTWGCAAVVLKLNCSPVLQDTEEPPRSLPGVPRGWGDGQAPYLLSSSLGRPEHKVVHPDDTQLIGGVDGRQGGHVHIEELDFRLILGGGLTQCPLHLLVEVLALIPGAQSRVSVCGVGLPLQRNERPQSSHLICSQPHLHSRPAQGGVGPHALSQSPGSGSGEEMLGGSLCSWVKPQTWPGLGSPLPDAHGLLTALAGLGAPGRTPRPPSGGPQTAAAHPSACSGCSQTHARLLSVDDKAPCLKHLSTKPGSHPGLAGEPGRSPAREEREARLTAEASSWTRGPKPQEPNGDLGSLNRTPGC